MEKTVHVNSYVKRDGTQVREHFRTIATDDYRTPPIVPEYPNYPVMDEKNNNPLDDLFPNIFNPTMGMDSVPVLQGGVSVDVGFPDSGATAGEGVLGNIFEGAGGVIGSIAQLLPLALEIYAGLQSGGAAAGTPISVATDAIMPVFNKGVQNLTNYHKQIKTDFENSVKKLVNAKNKAEYAKLYKPVTELHQAYKQTGDLLDRIKIHANNGDFQSVANDLGNFTSDEQKKIITDMLQPVAKMQRNTTNAINSINKYHIDDKFKYALSHNTSGVSRIADFTDYGNGNIKINNFLNKNRPNAKEMANIFLAKPQNIPLSKEYSYIPKGNATILNYKYKLFGTNKEIPQNWEGIVFNQYSSLSKNISNSIEMQNKIRAEFNIIKANTLNDKIEVDFSNDSNLHLSIGHATVLEPYIDSQGYFHGILFDKYDFDLLYKMAYKNPVTYIINDIFFIIQIARGHNFYILAPIIFKW